MSLSHPEHNVHTESAPGIWTVAFPIFPGGRLGRQVARGCRDNGGHFWHPSDSMIEWKCCRCGVSQDGMPKDGQ